MYSILSWRCLSSVRTTKTFRKRCGNGRGKQLWQKDTRDKNEDKSKEEASCFPLWARSVHGVRGSWLWQPPAGPSPVVAWHGQVQTWGGSTSGWGRGLFSAGLAWVTQIVLAAMEKREENPPCPASWGAGGADTLSQVSHPTASPASGLTWFSWYWHSWASKAL